MKTWTRERTWELRRIAELMHMGCKEAEAKVLFDAADAIEDLSKQVVVLVATGCNATRADEKIICHASEIVP